MNSSEKTPCTSCDGGVYEEVFTRYEATADDDVQIVIPHARLLRCRSCGDELIPPDTQQQIDLAVAEQSDQLSIPELEQICDQFGLDQTETAEVLGLGSKTINRWLKGHQHPNRSMSYYLRVLSEFPDAFEWLRERGWKRRNRIAQFTEINMAVQFRDLQWLTTLRSSVRDPFVSPVETPPHRFNPASLFRQTKVT